METDNFLTENDRNGLESIENIIWDVFVRCLIFNKTIIPLTLLFAFPSLGPISLCTNKCFVRVFTKNEHPSPLPPPSWTVPGVYPSLLPAKLQMTTDSCIAKSTIMKARKSVVFNVWGLPVQSFLENVSNTRSKSGADPEIWKGMVSVQYCKRRGRDE